MMKIKEEITEEDFAAYREVQQSGITNMFDVEAVSKLSKFSREKIIDIMENYSTYSKKWDRARTR